MGGLSGKRWKRSWVGLAQADGSCTPPAVCVANLEETSDNRSGEQGRGLVSDTELDGVSSPRSGQIYN